MRFTIFLMMACFCASPLTSCQLTATIVNGKWIQRTRVVDEQGNPLAASFNPGTPAPFLTKFNFTDKNGYILINPNIGSCIITSEGYQPFEASTKDFPKTVVMKKLSTKKSK